MALEKNRVQIITQTSTLFFLRRQGLAGFLFYKALPIILNVGSLTAPHCIFKSLIFNFISAVAYFKFLSSNVCASYFFYLFTMAFHIHLPFAWKIYWKIISVNPLLLIFLKSWGASCVLEAEWGKVLYKHKTQACHEGLWFMLLFMIN